MKIEEFVENDYAEKIRNILKKALDDCGITYEFRKDQLLTDWTKEVILAKM